MKRLLVLLVVFICLFAFTAVGDLNAAESKGFSVESDKEKVSVEKSDKKKSEESAICCCCCCCCCCVKEAKGTKCCKIKSAPACHKTGKGKDVKKTHP